MHNTRYRKRGEEENEGMITFSEEGKLWGSVEPLSVSDQSRIKIKWLSDADGFDISFDAMCNNIDDQLHTLSVVLKLFLRVGVTPESPDSTVWQELEMDL